MRTLRTHCLLYVRIEKTSERLYVVVVVVVVVVVCCYVYVCMYVVVSK